MNNAMKKEKHPLNLPKGSVRAILSTIIILGTFMYYLIYQEFPGALVTMSGVVTTFYFMQRMQETT